MQRLKDNCACFERLFGHELKIQSLIELGRYVFALHYSTFWDARVVCLHVFSQAAQTLFVVYIRDSIALCFEPFKRMYENGSKIALNSTFSKGFK